MNDDLLGSGLGFLRLGNGQWNLTFFLLRTRISNGSAGSRAPLPRTKSAKSRPPSGSLTPICFWPAALVAAIFQPTVAWPQEAAMAS